MTEGGQPISAAELRRFAPEAMEEPAAAKVQRTAFWILFIAAVCYSLWRLDFSFARFIQGVGKLGWLASLMVPPQPGGAFLAMLHAILETLAVAFLGTLMASVVAIPLGFLGARGVSPLGIFRFPLRRAFDLMRGIDSLIWALIFVTALGLGPFAGVLAIAFSDVGLLGKLYAEAIENLDQRPIAGVKAAGGSYLESARFGILPQLLPMVLSNSLYYLESNTRSASILGIVGGGGIGLLLSDRIRSNEWQQAAFILLLILITVSLLDMLSAKLRAKLSGASASALQYE